MALRPRRRRNLAARSALMHKGGAHTPASAKDRRISHVVEEGLDDWWDEVAQEQVDDGEESGHPG